jgi:hypothetical protein
MALLPLEQLRNYCGPKTTARCGFPRVKIRKRSIASVYIHCENALALDDFRYFEEDSVSIRSTSKNPLPVQGRSDFIRP